MAPYPRTQGSWITVEISSVIASKASNGNDRPGLRLFYPAASCGGNAVLVLQLLQDAPGHLFLENESEDLRTFLQLSMLSYGAGTSRRKPTM